MDDQIALDLCRHLPDAVVVVGAEGEIHWGNPAAERMFGVTLEDVHDVSALDLIHPDDAEFVFLALGTVQDKVAGSPIEIRIRAVDGWRLVELTGAPIGDGAIAACMRDLTQRRRYEIADGEEARFRSLVHNAGAVTMLLDADGTIQSVSAAITRLTGLDQEVILGRPFGDFLDPPDRAVLDAAQTEALPGAMTSATVEIGPKDRERVPMEFTIVNLLDDPTVAGYVLSGHDVTERVAAEEAVRSTLSLLEATLDSTADGILVVSREGRITNFNRRFAEMWRVPGELLDARDDDAVLRSVLGQLADPDAFLRKVEDLYADLDAESYDMIAFTDGRVFERFSRPQRVDGDVVGRVWSFRDLTEQKRLEDELVYRAFHDQLTGLANKARFCDRLQHAADRSRRTGEGFAVLFCDLDNFKTVNDSPGPRRRRPPPRRRRRDARELPARRRHPGPPRRRRVRGPARARRRPGERDRGRGAHPGLLPPADPRRRAGHGHDGQHRHRLRFGQLHERADPARRRRRHVPRQGARRRTASSCSPPSTTRPPSPVSRSRRTCGAPSAAEELTLSYQPIVDIATEEVVAVEALIRWEHPTRGLLRPDAFIPIAEDAGLMDDIGRQGLLDACRQTAGWRHGPAPDLAVSVNVSPRQLVGDTIVADVESALAASQLPPAALILEITETAMMLDTTVARRNLVALDALGVRLALDDFGTGYSSLTYLQQFPIDIVKIDKSFVASHRTEHGRAVARDGDHPARTLAGSRARGRGGRDP